MSFDGGGKKGDDERTCNFADAHQRLLITWGAAGDQEVRSEPVYHALLIQK